MALETTTDVEQLKSVPDGDGNAEPPANAAEQRLIRDRLGNWDGLMGFNYQTTSTDVEQMDSKPVPNGVTVAVQAPESNAQKVYIGSESAQPIAVQPGGTANLQVSDTGAIYVSALTEGDELGVLYEDG